MNKFLFYLETIGMPILTALLIVLALVVLVVFLMFLSRANKTVKTVNQRADNLLSQAEEAVEGVRPLLEAARVTVNNVNPVIERATLTLDAANLEIMRVDNILEDVSGVAQTAQSAVKKLDSISSAPLELASSAAKKVRNALTPAEAASSKPTSTLPALDELDLIPDEEIEAADEPAVARVSEFEVEPVSTDEPEPGSEQVFDDGIPEEAASIEEAFESSAARSLLSRVKVRMAAASEPEDPAPENAGYYSYPSE